MTTKKTKPLPTSVTIRITPSDIELAEALRSKLGVNALAEVYRMGLRALASQQGLSN